MLISSGSLCTRYCSNNLATSTDEHSLRKGPRDWQEQNEDRGVVFHPIPVIHD